MWPFRSKSDAEAQRLRIALDQAEDSNIALMQEANGAKIAMSKMQKALTDEGVAEIAGAATARIADIYAGHRGGVVARDIAVHAVIARAVREAARGEAHWHEIGQAADFYKGAT